MVPLVGRRRWCSPESHGLCYRLSDTSNTVVGGEFSVVVVVDEFPVETGGKCCADEISLLND